jgi:DNA replication protein DnaC
MSPARPDTTPAVKPIEVSAELKTLMRRLKLGQLLDTLPERLARARSNRLPHHDFLEMLLTDEVARRDRKSAQLRAKAAHLDPQMQLPAWDDTAAVTYDRQLWAELTSLRFLADAYNVLVMGPVGVGKTFLANALGHIAVWGHHSVHTERADKLFKRLRGARLDASYEDEMRKLHRVELLIIDDLALHRLEATETSDFYELIVERHRTASTIITSNREPPEILTMMADPPCWPSQRWIGCNQPPTNSSPTECKAAVDGGAGSTGSGSEAVCASRSPSSKAPAGCSESVGCLVIMAAYLAFNAAGASGIALL